MISNLVLTQSLSAVQSSHFQRSVLHVNYSDISGGAARAAYRIHKSIQQSNADIVSLMRVSEKLSDDPSVISGNPIYKPSRISRKLSSFNDRNYLGFGTINPVFHSFCRPSFGLGRELNACAQSLIHLHWIGRNLLSVEEIGRICKPVIWTLHDQWAFCGAEHYVAPPPLIDCRFIEGYTRRNRLRVDAEFGPDSCRYTWQRKRKAWKKKMQIVAPSRWMADNVLSSMLMHDWPTTVIPNPLDLDIWKPISKGEARQILGLPPDKSYLLFGAENSTDLRKGHDLLDAALQLLPNFVHEQLGQSLEILTFGVWENNHSTHCSFRVHRFGRLNDDISLKTLYSAADLFVLPSRQDNFPNTGIEAHACGTPVVAFRIGGLPDIVEEGATGALADPFSPDSLARKIAWILHDQQRMRAFSANARAKAAELWCSRKVAVQYTNLYQSLLERH